MWSLLILGNSLSIDGTVHECVHGVKTDTFGVFIVICGMQFLDLLAFT